MKKFLIVLVALAGLWVTPALAQSPCCCPTQSSPGTLPYTLTNGKIADANQVMADFNALLYCLGSAGNLFIDWPATPDIVISNQTNSPNGLAPVNGDCVVGSGGNWIAGTCGACSGGAGAILYSPSGTNCSGDVVTSNGAAVWTAPTSLTVDAQNSSQFILANNPSLNGGNLAGGGGNITMTSGLDTNTASNSSVLTLFGANVDVGGFAELQAGDGASGGVGGTLTLLAGNATGAGSVGGQASLLSGSSSSGFGGQLFIEGGDGNSTTPPAPGVLIESGANGGGNGSDIDITAGESSGTSATGGNVVISGGNADSPATTNGGVSILTTGSGGIGAFTMDVGASTISTGALTIQSTTVASSGITINANGADLVLKSNAGHNINLETSGAIEVNTSSVGVNCSGSPTSSFASVKGIVTHC